MQHNDIKDILYNNELNIDIDEDAELHIVPKYCSKRHRYRASCWCDPDMILDNRKNKGSVVYLHKQVH